MEIREYVNPKGKIRFTDWLRKLKDRKARQKIHTQIDRLRLGNAGDHKALGNGIFEMRIHYGPGYRVYYGKTSDMIILLLCGGNKATQQQDVKIARQYWMDYRRR